jgi:hypothetical protein
MVNALSTPNGQGWFEFNAPTRDDDAGVASFRLESGADSMLPWTSEVPSVDVEVGTLRMERTPARRRFEWTAVDGDPQSAEIDVYAVLGPRGLRLELGDLRSSSDLREIRLVNAFESSQDLKDIENRLRMPVHRNPRGRHVFLPATERRRGQRPGRAQVDWQSLDEASRVNVRTLLRKHGAIEMGTKAAVLRTDERPRNLLCCLFRESDALLPLVAFLATRVLPLVRSAR